jgi:uncharacterized protein (TIGR02246 family)
MDHAQATGVDGATVAAIHQLYGRQSHLIDGGDAKGWARTFTPDGEFHSPSYPEPLAGVDALTEFARRFHSGALEGGERLRHVITNLVVDRVDPRTLAVTAYLQIVATQAGGDSRLVRFTTIADTVVDNDGHWLVSRRDVTRDDAAIHH